MIKGLRELDRKLASIEGMPVRKGVEKGIQFVQGVAKENCPVGDGELKNSIFTNIQENGDITIGSCFTNKSYGLFVEMGTGPKGQESHAGVSPNINVVYNQSSWWIHESQICRSTAEKYHWFYIETPDGRFYQCSGQPAQPFLYPALKNHKDEVANIIRDELKKEIRRSTK